MELVLALLLLYGLQCMIRLPRGDLLFVRPLLTWYVTAGPGWRLLHPIPSGACALASRFILTEDEAGLCGREAPGEVGSTPLRRSLPRFDLEASDEVEARGKTVRVGGTTFLRARTRHAAEEAAGLLRDLRGKRHSDIRKRVTREMHESLSLATYRNESERLQRATRLLAWSSDLYVLCLFVGLPILIWREHSERAVIMLLPVILAAHIFTLIALLVSHRRLFPGQRAERFEALASCAIYPPGLLRALQDMKDHVLSRYHPAVVAAALLPKEDLARFLRSELGRAELAASRDRDNPESLGLAALERDALNGLIEACGESRETLMAPPAHENPFALTYCPICLGDYLIAQGTCVDCGVALARYAD